MSSPPTAAEARWAAGQLRGTCFSPLMIAAFAESQRLQASAALGNPDETSQQDAAAFPGGSVMFWFPNLIASFQSLKQSWTGDVWVMLMQMVFPNLCADSLYFHSYICKNAFY